MDVDVAARVVQLASEAGRACRGACVAIDAGVTAGIGGRPAAPGATPW